MSTSRRRFLATAALLWEQAVASAQQDINAQQQQIERQKHQHGPAAELKPSKYRYGFLTASEQQVLRRLADRIVPADARSGGAAAARVDEYVDFVLGHANARLQKAWRDGLGRYGKAIAGKQAAGIDRFLEQQAVNEFHPGTPDEEFFVLLKAATVEGFYTSQEGILKELGYQGLAYVPNFPGCTHPDGHKAPADYQPLLRDRS